MTIQTNKVVSCHYTLREGTALGELIESTEGGAPLAYIHGVGMMIPAFEEQLNGKVAGDEFAFGIKADEAYGAYDETLLTTIPFAAFGFDGTVNPQDIFVEGEVVPLTDAEGNQFMAAVMKTTDSDVTVDLNHPMSGVDLYFVGRVEGVRDAEPSELEHGHVHGEGGVHHD